MFAEFAEREARSNLKAFQVQNENGGRTRNEKLFGGRCVDWFAIFAVEAFGARVATHFIVAGHQFECSEIV